MPPGPAARIKGAGIEGWRCIRAVLAGGPVPAAAAGAQFIVRMLSSF
jgi:hypothetical protein